MGAAARTKPRRKQRLTKKQQALVAANLGLAGAAARPFARQVSRDDADDLRQEAMIGLCYAAIHFDPKHSNRRGGKVKYSTYGTWAAIHSIRTYLKTSRRRKHMILTQAEHVSDLTEFVAPDDDDGGGDGDERDRRLAAIDDAMARLHPRHAEVLRSRAAGDTLKVIGDRLGLSKERIRQLEMDAYAHVRRILNVEDVP